MEALTPTAEDAASLRALIDTIVDGVVIIDSRGTVRVFNPACEKLFGYAAGEVIGKNVSMLMPEPYRSEHDRYLDAYHRTGDKRIIGIGREVVGRRKDGTTFPMELSVGETRLGSGNAYVGVIRDISERKEAERRLRDGEARLRAVIDTVVDGVVIIDAQGIIRMFNPASEWIFGYRQREVIGKNVSMLMPEPYHSQHDEYLRNYKRTGERKIIGIGREVTGRRKDGTAFPMELSVGETVQSGEQVFVGVIRDISDRKQAEDELRRARDEALEAAHAKSVLLMELNHRVRNNLALILGVLRVQRRRALEPQTAEIVDDIIGRVESVGAVQNLIFEAEAYGVLDRKIIVKICEAVRTGFERAGVALSVRVGEDVGFSAQAAMPLTMILTEFLLNAYKHAFPAAATDARIDVDLEKDGDEVVLTVRDNGTGMDVQQVREGALGLRLIDMLAKQISGRPEYRSDGGTVAVVRFPAVAPSANGGDAT